MGGDVGLVCGQLRSSASPEISTRQQTFGRTSAPRLPQAVQDTEKCAPQIFDLTARLPRPKFRTWSDGQWARRWARRPDVMTNTLLQDVGVQLYGPRWQTDLSRAIDVSDRTMRRWISGEDNIPEGAWRDILGRLEGRIAELEVTKRRLSGLLGSRSLKTTLAPIPNGKARAELEGVEFAMFCSFRRQPVRCLARREIFDDHGCADRPEMLAFFERHAERFYRAASVKHEMGEIEAPTRILIGNDDILIPRSAR
jgi:hypothetical protein